VTGGRIAVTGASGGLGAAVIEQLLRLVPAERVIASVRDPGRVHPLVQRGVDVRRADFGDAASLDAAFAGADRVLVISTNAPDNDARFAQHARAIDAARRANAGRVFYTSIVQRRGTPFLAARGHHDTEDHLARTEVPHTVFRNGHYMENLPAFLGSAAATGVLELPADGPTAWVARDDLAEGIARRLVAPAGEHESLLLTGPAAYDFAAIAALVTTRIGIRIDRRVIAAESYVHALVARGFPGPVARLLASGFASRAAGELADVDPTLERILQRPLRTLDGELPRLLRGSGRP
jgi:uncharacterized protein YbjT (DUF2867 family)